MSIPKDPREVPIAGSAANAQVPAVQASTGSHEVPPQQGWPSPPQPASTTNASTGTLASGGGWLASSRRVSPSLGGRRPMSASTFSPQQNVASNCAQPASS